MSAEAENSIARAPKRERGKQRVAELLQAAAAVFAEKGYEAATMTEIAARADATDQLPSYAAQTHRDDLARSFSRAVAWCRARNGRGGAAVDQGRQHAQRRTRPGRPRDSAARTARIGDAVSGAALAVSPFSISYKVWRRW